MTSVFVEDQQKALEFYRDKLGFTVKVDAPMGEYRWLTLAAPEGHDDVVLLLEPNNDPIARTYQQGLKAAGKPCTSFEVRDVTAAAEKLKAEGVNITVGPVIQDWGSFAMFDDTCGNLISIHAVGKSD
jgi:predicted enzyme related to lactoylglutathione lyase